MKKMQSLLFFFIFSTPLIAQKITIEEYVNTYKDIAMKEMVRSGVPASITLAQGILETENGNSALVKKSNNHFGIKCKETWKGPSVSHDDDAPQECFRKYDDAIASYIDHSDFLRTRKHYHFLFDLDPLDYKAWAYGLKKAGYATNPKYPMILIKYIETYNLNDYSLMAMGKKPEEKINQPSDEDKTAVAEPVTIPALQPIEKEEVVVVAVNPVKEKEAEKPLPKKDEIKAEPSVQQRSGYPFGEFKINDTRVVYAEAGTSLLSLASSYNIPLKYLYDFNDFTVEKELLENAQLIYLQRKRKVGAVDYHIVEQGETLYDVAQKRGIRMEALLHLNYLSRSQNPAAGQKLYLQNQAPSIPEIASADVASKLAEVNKQTESDEYEVHVVQPKETLYGISKKYNVSIQQLMQWNDLTGTDLKHGTELIVSQKDYDVYKSTQ